MATKPIFNDVPAWPEAQPAAVHMGHNKPPLEEIIPEEFRAELLREKPDFLNRMNDLVTAADRAHAEDDDSLGRCGDLVNAYRSAIKHIDVTHKAVKQPHLDAGRLVDAEKNALVDRVNDAKRKVETIGNAFIAKREAAQRAERERIATEQRAAAERAAQAEASRVRAEREAAEAQRAATTEDERKAAAERAAQAARDAEEAMAAAALAPAADNKPDPVRSDAGSTVSGKQEWQAEIEDYAKAFKAVKTDPKVKEAMDAAIKRLVRAGQREIAGVRIWPVAKASFR